MNNNQPFNVSEFINNERLSGYQRLIIILCGLVAVLDGFDTQSIAFVAPVMAGQWGLQTTDFGSVFAIGLFGLMVGSMLFGPLADRYGRKRVIIICLIIVGVFSLLTISSDSISDLIMFRFFTGIGLGGIIPNILALTAEYSPRRVLNTTVTIMFCGFPLGAVLGGLIMARIIPKFGWEIVFYAGGFLPLLLVPVIITLLPESIRFLVSKKVQSEKVVTILKRIQPALNIKDSVRFAIDEDQGETAYVKKLFSGGLAKTTLLLWVIYFMSLFMFYSLVNWLPTILKTTGVPIEKAILSTALFNLGGIVGGIITGRLIDKGNRNKILTVMFILAAIVIAIIGSTLGFKLSVILGMIFLSGFFVMGSTFGVQALMTGVYPTSVRSTGIGWALGIGRVGAIVGPMAAGIMLSLKIEISFVFIAWATPALVAAAAIIFLKSHSNRGDSFVNSYKNDL